MVDMLVLMIRRHEKTLEDIQRDMPKSISNAVAKKVKALQAQLGSDFYLN